MLYRRILSFAILPVGMGLALLQPFASHAATGPTVSNNSLVDQDHNLAFPKNKQNEPSITRDPQTGVLVAGANDEFDNPYCKGTSTALASPCPFAKGEQISAYYVSKNNGRTWSGGYLPGFDTIGRASGGDPSLTYGPRLCANGLFSYSCGVVIYYASLADPVNADLHFSEATTVSRTYDDGAHWSNPGVVNALNKTSDFDDHEWIAVDNAPSAAGRPFFGRVYLFIAIYCGECAGNGNVKLVVVHSDDEGQTWSSPVQVSATASGSGVGTRETGQMAVASDGTVEVFWTENENTTKYPHLQVVATSTDGGHTFTAPITISQVTDYPWVTPFDNVDPGYNRVPGSSARVDCYPHPASDPSSTKVYVVWCDFSGGNGNGVVDAAVSSDGIHWASLGTIAQVPNTNAFFPAASVASNGTVSVDFDAMTAEPGVTGTNYWPTLGGVTYDTYYTELLPGAKTFSTPIRVSTQSSNPDGSSYNILYVQFIGDYIGIVSGDSSAYLVWTDSRNAAACAAVDKYRNDIYAGMSEVPPNPDFACSADFGNTDTYEATVNY